MKPETKRWLAKEWLIFVGMSIAVWMSLFGIGAWIQYDDAYDEFWSQTETGKRACDDLNRPAVAIPPHQRDPFEEFGGKQIDLDVSERQEMSKQWNAYVQTLPLVTRVHARIYGAKFGALESLDKLRAEPLLQPLVEFYFFLWIPRLTVRAVQTLRKKPEIAE